MHGARYQTHFQVPRSKGVEKQQQKGERNISSENTANEESTRTASTIFSDKVHVQHSRVRLGAIQYPRMTRITLHILSTKGFI